MSVNPIRYGMIGGGRGAFIGGVHRTAAAIAGNWRLVAGAFSSTPGCKSNKVMSALVNKAIEKTYAMELSHFSRANKSTPRPALTPTNIKLYA